MILSEGGSTISKVGSYICTYNGLSRQLRSVVDRLDYFSDSIVVSVDADSDDGTVDWCRSHDSVDSVLVDDRDFLKHEPDIRRRAFDHLRSLDDFDYLCSFDDDEVILDEEVASIAFSQGKDLISTQHYNIWIGWMYRCDDPWFSSRIIGVKAALVDDLSWNNHSPHCGRIPSRSSSGFSVDVSMAIPVAHFGWDMSRREQIDKMKRRLEEDRYRWENPDITDFPRQQKKLYRSFVRGPELQKLPDKYRERLTDVKR